MRRYCSFLLRDSPMLIVIQCPAGPTAVHSRVYRCTCFQNYCSSACHQADWPEHKKDRHAPDLPSGPQEIVLKGMHSRGFVATSV